MRKVIFHKYHGLENDFLVIDLKSLRLPVAHRSDLAEQICSRNVGVGADGVLYYSIIRDKPLMLLFNADGSSAEISGNGLRILAQHLTGLRLVKSGSFTIHTLAGDSSVDVISRSGLFQLTRINLGKPEFLTKEIPMRADVSYFINRLCKTDSGALIGTAVNVGNPHIVFFVDNFDFDWRTYGAEVENDKRFPERTNVEFAVIKSRKRLMHRSWERGAGATRASATGAAAAVAAGVINGLLDRHVKVQEPAGTLAVQLEPPDDSIFLTGPSVKIGEGIFYYDVNG